MVDERKARRERQRRQIRRQRRIVAGTFVLAVSAVAGILLSNAGGSPRTMQASDWHRHTGAAPILEYHVLGAAPADSPTPTSTSAAPTSKQMNWLDNTVVHSSKKKWRAREQSCGAITAFRSRTSAIRQGDSTKRRIAAVKAAGYTGATDLGY